MPLDYPKPPFISEIGEYDLSGGVVLFQGEFRLGSPIAVPTLLVLEDSLNDYLILEDSVSDRLILEDL